ncbi:MAG: hypothetical protein HFF29_08595 [Oscillospiraceae bacterium]|nr:hypothetical protein [Oscillospiraceae bacterium]
MQQTNKYKLNLIEKTDTFSPDPLNDNMEKVERALEAETAGRSAADAALDRRLQVFEAHHVAVGTYTPQKDKVTNVDIGFSPSMILIHALGTTDTCGVLMAGHDHPNGKITSNGFQIGAAGSGGNINYFYMYAYIAFD